MGAQFQEFITALERQQVEFDLGSENIILNHGSVRGDRFIVGKRAYGTVVLPAQMENVDAATFALLRRFAAKGGRIICYGAPRYVDGVPSAEAESFFADAAQVTRAMRRSRRCGALRLVRDRVRPGAGQLPLPPPPPYGRRAGALPGQLEPHGARAGDGDAARASGRAARHAHRAGSAGTPRSATASG